METRQPIKGHTLCRESLDVQASLILAEVIQSGLPICPNNLQSTYQWGMSDFRNVVGFRASAVVPVRRRRPSPGL